MTESHKYVLLLRNATTSEELFVQSSSRGDTSPNIQDAAQFQSHQAAAAAAQALREKDIERKLGMQLHIAGVQLRVCGIEPVPFPEARCGFVVHVPKKGYYKGPKGRNATVRDLYAFVSNIDKATAFDTQALAHSRAQSYQHVLQQLADAPSAHGWQVSAAQNFTYTIEPLGASALAP